MKRGTLLVSIVLATTIPLTTFGAYSGATGSAGPVGGPYVPVFDGRNAQNFVDYIGNFNKYVKVFEDQLGNTMPNGTTDSLRDLISGSDPKGLANAPCKQGNNVNSAFPNAAFPYTTGPWSDAIKDLGADAHITNGIPAGATAAGPFVQVNYSQSLRCLLNDVVNWQKLGVSVQIHSLLKEYIADAQAKQLNNQLKNKIAAANLDWSRAGNEVDDNGMLSTQPVFNTNPSQSQYNSASRQLEHLADQAAADPSSGNPVGSLGIAEPWRLQTTADMVTNARGGVEDPFFFTESLTQETLTPALDPNDFGKFMLNFNDPANKVSGMETFKSMLTDRANSPLGAMDLASEIAQSRIENQKITSQQKQSNSGFIPTTQCSGLASDPYCLNQQYGIDTNPAAQNQQVVTEMASQGDRQVEQAQTLDAKGGPAAENQSTQLNSGGVLNYDTTPLATSTTIVNKLVQELYDTMWNGYFGVDDKTSEWAQATMLMIYDEMKFSSTSPETVITKDTTDLPTNY